MAVVRRIESSNFYGQEIIQYRFQPVGEWMWLDGERMWVWVNMECSLFSDESTRQYYYPTEKACYSHSPPDMDLSVYNQKRHQLTFMNQMQHLFSRLQQIADEKMSNRN